MKKTFLITFVLLLGILVAVSCDPNYLNLDGNWVGYEVAGYDNPMRFVISGEKLKVYQTTNGSEILAYEGVITYNNDARPRYMDITITDTLYTHYIGKTSLGIYQIGGNFLILCNEEPGNGLRPTTFTADGNPRLFMLRR